MNESRYEVPKLSKVTICLVPNQDGNSEGRCIGPITRKAVRRGVPDLCPQTPLGFTPPAGTGSQRSFNPDPPAWLHLVVLWLYPHPTPSQHLKVGSNLHLLQCCPPLRLVVIYLNSKAFCCLPAFCWHSIDW